MLLGLPSQMGIKLDLDSTIYMCFNTKSAKYHLHSISMARTSDLINDQFRLVSEDITEISKDLHIGTKKDFASYCFIKDKIFTVSVTKSIFNALRIGVYEHQSKLLREKWHNTTQQNNYKKLNIG